jgi:hypothetical protein
MSFLTGHGVIRRTVIVAITLIVALFGYTGAALAYGPPVPPPGPPGVGGFGCVLTSELVPALTGATLGPLADGELSVTLHVPPYTFRRPVQVTITEPYSLAGPCGAGPLAAADLRFQPVGGVGVLITVGNEPVWSFPRPVWLTIDDPDISGFQFGEVVPLDGGHSGVGGQRTRGPITFGVDNSSDWLYLVSDPHRFRGFGGDTADAAGARFVQPAATVTALLLPDGRTLPGAGVVLAFGAGHPLTVGTASALTR